MKAHISGVGGTAFGRHEGQDTLQLMARAANGAIGDAGVNRYDVPASAPKPAAAAKGATAIIVRGWENWRTETRSRQASSTSTSRTAPGRRKDSLKGGRMAEKKKKPYLKPDIKSEKILESAALACGKCSGRNPTGQGAPSCRSLRKLS